MSIIQGIKNYKYHCAINLLKREESHDKKRVVLTGEEAFKRCYDRYSLIQDILLPLKEKIGDRVDVTDIYFTNTKFDDSGIIVKYLKDDKQFFLAISNLDGESLNVVSSDISVQKYDFIERNKDIVFKAFKEIDDNSLDDEIVIYSSSRKFVVRDNCDSFNIKDDESKSFTIEKKYSSYAKTNDLYTPSNIICSYPKLKELLMDSNNIKLIYDHLHVYDEELPKIIEKKLTYR